ncbi:STAG domain-containing protein [Lipomyces orientalis]|uniref:STAG domain-containing protein n=1 Tax=Lipomyces orientalis TaxID=1233043 RepID=A0ACC3TQU6_9ASCO
MPARTVTRTQRRSQLQSPKSSQDPSSNLSSAAPITDNKLDLKPIDSDEDVDMEEEPMSVGGIVDKARQARLNSASTRKSAAGSRQYPKRKRGDISGSDEDEEPDSAEEQTSDESDDENMEEGDKEDAQSDNGSNSPAAAARRQGRHRAGAPAKSKLSSEIATTARHRISGPRNRTRGSSETQETAGNLNALFEAVKDPGTALEETAADWIQNYERKKVEALMELVNFILQCCGCDSSVTAYDIEDQDSATQTLAQIEEVFGKKTISDYPLVSRRPEFKKFRSHLLDFVGALITKGAEHDTLYSDDSFLESIQVWIAAMSSSTLRPFRYTATTIGLCILTGLCNVAADIAKATGRSTKLLEKEKRRPARGNAKVQKLQDIVDVYARNAETLENLISDLFDTIFVHRYRDIDAKIRTECIRELGKWMQTLPDVFFEGAYLRYMGWILSDANGSTRLEVVKGLTKLYKDNYFIGGLRQFTERFTSRLVEMATHDVDHSVRIAVIDLLDAIRAVGFLEQEDIDMVCGLVFDTNPRVRKAVVGFFMANIKEIVSEKLTEIGDVEEIREYLVDNEAHEIDDSSDKDGRGEENKVKRSWFTLKSIVEVLESYNPQALGNPIHVSKLESLIGGRTESRFSIAAQDLWTVAQLPSWTDIVDYALFDPSVSDDDDEDSIGYKIKNAIALTAQQEQILLEVGIGAVDAADSPQENLTDKRVKRVKGNEREERLREISETLVPLLPRLLKKFSSDPEAACNVLRYHNFINLDVYQQLRQTAAYEDVFTGICKIFASFGNSSIAREFSRAVLHAQSCAYLSEVVEPRIRDIQDDLSSTFRTSMRESQNDLATAVFDKDVLATATEVLTKLMHLSSITDTSETLDYSPRDSDISALRIVMELLERTVSPDDEEVDVLCAGVSTLRFYLMWRVKRAIDLRSNTSLHGFREKLEEVMDRFERIIRSRADLNLRHTAICATIDIMTSLNVLVKKENLDLAGIEVMISPNLQNVIMHIFSREEKAYAKSAKIRLLTGGSTSAEKVDETPVEEDGEEENIEDSDLEGLSTADVEEEEESNEGGNREAVSDEAVQTIENEIRLCEVAGKIVLAVLTGSMKQKWAKRLLQNSKAFGAGYDRVVNELRQAISASNGQKR